MGVEMVNRLPRRRPIGLDQVQTFGIKRFIDSAGDDLCRGQYRRQISRVRIQQVNAMSLGQDQAVAVLKGVDVHHGVGTVIFVQLERRFLARDDFAEIAVRVGYGNAPDIKMTVRSLPTGPAVGSLYFVSPFGGLAIPWPTL